MIGSRFRAARRAPRPAPPTAKHARSRVAASVASDRLLERPVEVGSELRAVVTRECFSRSRAGALACLARRPWSRSTTRGAVWATVDSLVRDWAPGRGRCLVTARHRTFGRDRTSSGPGALRVVPSFGNVDAPVRRYVARNALRARVRGNSGARRRLARSLSLGQGARRRSVPAAHGRARTRTAPAQAASAEQTTAQLQPVEVTAPAAEKVRAAPRVPEEGWVHSAAGAGRVGLRIHPRRSESPDGRMGRHARARRKGQETRSERLRSRARRA